MKELIVTMLDTQRLVNEATIGQDWVARAPNFYLAMQQECAEGIDHLGWKWWTKQEPNNEAARMEVIDVLHFVLAAAMARGYGERSMSPQELADELRREWNCRFLPFVMDAQKFQPKLMQPTSLFSLVSTMAGLQLNPFGMTFTLAESLGMGFNDVYRLYSGKAVLNLFRQRNGYRNGTYQKMWRHDGHLVEDNAVLQNELMPKIDWEEDDAPHALFHALANRYALERLSGE